MRIGGILQFTADGIVYSAKGEWEYSLMEIQAKMVAGAHGIDGYTETAVPPYIQGEITDRSDLDVKALIGLRDVTITLAIGNGKMIVLQNGTYTGDGKVGSAEGNIEVKFEGTRCEEV